MHVGQSLTSSRPSGGIGNYAPPQLSIAGLLRIQRQAVAGEFGKARGNQHMVRLMSARASRGSDSDSPRPASIQRAVDGSPGAALADALARGVRSETQLTDLVFYERHPERNRRSIDPQGEAELVQEWLAIRAQEVRPALSTSVQSPVASTTDIDGVLHEALASGVRNEVRLTDLLFFARHPERSGRLIDPQGEANLVQEWVMLRNTQVRPALAAGGSPTASSNGRSEPAPAERAVPARPQPASSGGPEARTEAPVADPVRAPDSVQGTVDTEVQGSETDKVRQIEGIVQALRQLQREAETASGQAGGTSDSRFWRALGDTSAFRHYKEAGVTAVQAMADMLRTARTLLRSLTTADVGGDPGTLANIQGRYNRELNALTPYFTQMANQNWLYSSDMRAWERTCNLTSLAMTIEAMGLQPKDFQGDSGLLTQVAQRFESRFASFSDLAALRMPDFLQLVMIYVKLPQAGGATFEQRVDQARGLAASVIAATLDIFVQVAAQFGVERTATGQIRSTGQLAHDQNGGSVATGQYQQEVLDKLTPWLDQGGQVVVNKPGHYVRLEAVEPSGLMIDDPATNGKNYLVGWDDANLKGYFRSYQVFMKW